MKLKISLLIISFCLICPTLSAQASISPNDELYEWLDIWYTAGYLAKLPNQRPYSPSLVNSYLRTILENDRVKEIDRKMAAFFLKQSGILHAEAEVKARSDFSGYYLQLGTRFWGQGPISDWIDASIDAGQWLIKNPDGFLLGDWKSLNEDFVDDYTTFGEGTDEIIFRQFPALGVDFHPAKDLTLHLGINRNSIGPFWSNGVIFGPQSPASGAFTFAWDIGSGISADYGFYPIIATTNEGKGSQSGKYLYYHSINMDLSSDIILSVFETIISGGRIEPLYFIPLSVFFTSQGLGGYSDNSLLGFTLQAKLSDGLRLSGVLFIDDMHFNDLVRFNFNTKYKLAYQVGASWNPSVLGDIEFFKELKLDFTAVMPYMYTHYNGAASTEVNWDNYTNRGKSIGADLAPNSARLNLDSKFVANENLGFNLNLSYIVHGNASAGVGVGGLADGSIFDPGYTGGGVATFQSPFVDPTGQPYTRFLTQSVLEHLVQAELKVDFVLPNIDSSNENELGFGSLKAELGYLFQIKNNADLVLGQSQIKNIISFNIGYWY